MFSAVFFKQQILHHSYHSPTLCLPCCPGHMMTPTYPFLMLERECPSTFLPKDAANELTVMSPSLPGILGCEVDRRPG